MRGGARSREIQVVGDRYQLKLLVERNRLGDICSHRNRRGAFRRSRTTPRRVRGRNWPLRRCGGQKTLIRYVRTQNFSIPPLTFPNATIRTRSIPEFQRFSSKTIFPSGVVIHAPAFCNKLVKSKLCTGAPISPQKR